MYNSTRFSPLSVLLTAISLAQSDSSGQDAAVCVQIAVVRAVKRSNWKIIGQFFHHNGVDMYSNVKIMSIDIKYKLQTFLRK